jgi:hypothetical protein
MVMWWGDFTRDILYRKARIDLCSENLGDASPECSSEERSERDVREMKQ